MKFTRKPIEVEAMKLTGKIQIEEAIGGPGDYLVTMPGGEMEIWGGPQFEAEFQPAATAQITVTQPERLFLPTVTTAPTANDKAKLREEERQTEIASCFTCGQDVRTRDQDGNKDCPECAKKNAVLHKPAPEGTKRRTPKIVCCSECGLPLPGSESIDGRCGACSKALTNEA